MRHFTPTDLISSFSSCPKLKFSYGCDTPQLLVAKIQKKTKSLLHTIWLEYLGGVGGGKKQHHIKGTMTMKSA